MVWGIVRGTSDIGMTLHRIHWIQGVPHPGRTHVYYTEIEPGNSQEAINIRNQQIGHHDHARPRRASANTHIWLPRTQAKTIARNTAATSVSKSNQTNAQRRNACPTRPTCEL